jgi:hypothetical protein
MRKPAKAPLSGFKAKKQDAGRGLAGRTEYQEGRGFAHGGNVRSGSVTGGAGSGQGRLRHSRSAAKIPPKTEL